MTEKFSSALAQNLKITSKESAELRVIINYINKILKHNISFLPERKYESELNTSDFLLSLSIFLSITEMLKKYAPPDFVKSEEIHWPQLVMNVKIPDEQAQQSQHLSDITELQAISYFTKKIEKIQKIVGSDNLTFRFNSSCDIFNNNPETSKIDIIYDVYYQTQHVEIAIECKYLSYAFFTELIVKNLFNHENENLQILNKDVSNNLKLMFSQCDPFTNYSNSKINLGTKLLESLSIIEKNQKLFTPYVSNALNQIISFNVNKKHKQMKNFKEESKNILFISLCDLIEKHNTFQGTLSDYYSQPKENIAPLRISVTDNNFHNIKWVILSYRHHKTTYIYYELTSLIQDEGVSYYEYNIIQSCCFNSFFPN